MLRPSKNTRRFWCCDYSGKTKENNYDGYETRGDASEVSGWLATLNAIWNAALQK